MVASGLFLAAAFTDVLDGYLARVLNQSTRFGEFLDPVVDKLMVMTALVLLVEDYSSAWISLPAIFMIGRELIVSALREWMAELGKRGHVAVSMVGKVKTTFQMVAIAALLWHATPEMVYLGYLLVYIGDFKLYIFDVLFKCSKKRFAAKVNSCDQKAAA